MASTQEYNQFRRLVGDYGVFALTTLEIDKYLDDACLELTGDFATPVITFTTLVNQYRYEVILKGAINWWWNTLSQLQAKHSVTVGVAAQNVSEKWDRAFQMIQALQTEFDDLSILRIDVTIGNFSRYSKQTLRRIGGIREEDTHA